MSIIISTVSGETSNCYISLADADIYFDDTLTEAIWNQYTDAEKERALIQATKQIERQFLDGVRYDEDQALHFPRSNDYNSENKLEIPQDIEDATCEQALYLLRQMTSPDLIDRRELQFNGVKEILIDGYRETYTKQAKDFSLDAWQLLCPYLIRQAHILPRGEIV